MDLRNDIEGELFAMAILPLPVATVLNFMNVIGVISSLFPKTKFALFACAMAQLRSLEGL